MAQRLQVRQPCLTDHVSHLVWSVLTNKGNFLNCGLLVHGRENPSGNLWLFLPVLGHPANSWFHSPVAHCASVHESKVLLSLSVAWLISSEIMFFLNNHSSLFGSDFHELISKFCV